MVLKKGLVAGIANLILGIILNKLLNVMFPSLATEYQNSMIFRPWDDPLMMLYFAYPFILALSFAYFWNMTGKQCKGATSTQKAFEFAKFYFLIATIPGMFISYTSFQLSALMIIAWTFVGFLQAYVAGWVFAKMNNYS